MTSTRYPHLAWQPTRPGHWEREIDEAEQFYTFIAKAHEGTGRMFFAITGFVSLTVENNDISKGDTALGLEEAFRQAWLRLRYTHPTIASRVEYDPWQQKWLKSYTAFDHERLEAMTEEWLQETYRPLSPAVAGLEWCNADPPAPKLPTLFIITPPDADGNESVVRRDLVIRSPHDIMDGIGTLQLLNKLLQYAAAAYQAPSEWSPPFPGTEIANLSPPLRVAASIPPILTLDQQDQLQHLIRKNDTLGQGIEVLTIPYMQGTTQSGKHQRTALNISKADTTQLSKAVRELGATLTHVFHAAIAVSIRDLQERRLERRSARYISYALINERARCTGEYANPDHAAAVYHSVSGDKLALDLIIPAVTDAEEEDDRNKVQEFHFLLEQVKEYYHAIRDSSTNLALSPSFFSMATPHISNPNMTATVPPPNLSPSVSLSSMGVVDKIISPQHGPFKINTPWVTGVELGTGLGVFLGTWEGSLCLSAAYNDAWHDREEVEGFLKHVQGVVWKGLGLDHG